MNSNNICQEKEQESQQVEWKWLILSKIFKKFIH